MAYLCVSEHELRTNEINMNIYRRLHLRVTNGRWKWAKGKDELLTVTKL